MFRRRVMWFAYKNRFKNLVLLKKTQYLVTKLYIYKKIFQNVYKCIYVHKTSFAYRLLKIYNIYNVNYRLTVELQSTYRIITLKTSKEIIYHQHT